MLDWSHSRLPPFAHQLEDTAALIAHPFFFIASEMRTGKTKIVIDAAQFLFDSGTIERVIVLCPEPVRGVWLGADADALGGELQEHLWLKTPALVTEFHSKVNQWRVGPAGQELRVIVTNYEFVRPYKRKNATHKNDDVLRKLLQYCTSKTLLVLDESGAITGWKSETFDACFKMRQKCGRVVLMNGTPQDTPINLFAQGRMLSDDILECKFITHFKNRYAEEVPVTGRSGKALVTPYGKQIMQIKSWKNIDDLQRRFAPYTIRRLQADCPDIKAVKLKPVTLKAELDASDWTIYKDMRDDLVVELQSGHASVSQQAIVKFMRLSQITGGFLGGIEATGLDPVCENCDGQGCDACEGSGVGVVQPSESVRELGRAKLNVLLWLLGNKLEKDPNVKIVTWARFLPETLRILDVVKQKFPQMLVAGLHGKQSKKQRAETKAILHPKTAPEGPVLACCTLGSGSYGLDFSSAHISVNYSYDHSLRKALQSQDRVYGPRQLHDIENYDIVAVGPRGQRTYDSVIVQARRDKQELATLTQSAWVKTSTFSKVDVAAFTTSDWVNALTSHDDA